MIKHAFIVIFVVFVSDLGIVNCQETLGAGNLVRKFANGSGRNAKIEKHLLSKGITLTVVDSVAILQGAVDSKEDYELAEQVANDYEDITKVENNLTVRDGTDPNAEDYSYNRMSEIAQEAAIKLKLLANQKVSGASVDAEIVDNALVVSGEVDGETEKELLKKKLSQDTSMPIIDNLEVGSGKSLNESSSDMLTILFYLFLIVIISLLTVVYFVQRYRARFDQTFSTALKRDKLSLLFKRNL